MTKHVMLRSPSPQKLPGGCRLSARALSVFRRELLRWFDQHRRDLPWRGDRDPYRVWVSEVMLQQTTVAAVIPKFKEFVRAFPTLQALAAAREEDVLRAWEGLGYYRRARHLHQAARMLVDEHDGQLPSEPSVWAALPGVGRYILGAVLSQAFDRRMPIVEANSLRVLCRLFGQAGDPKSARIQRWLWQTAEALLPANRAGDFNQALMELGALVCTPAQPACAHCPLAAQCEAKRLELQATIPMCSPRSPVTETNAVAIVVRKDDRVLVVRRPESGRWASLWEFPRGEIEELESVDRAAARMLAELTNVRADLNGHFMVVRHSIMRFRVKLTCLTADYRSGTFRSKFYAAGKWIRPRDLSRLPFSSPQRQLARAVQMAFGQGHRFASPKGR